ncbi:MAG TPA: hypothetical protein VGT61_06345 [Thermomicrobiales bacterium]|jgi:hypothetical protein|nr:hypothetical protein [Thermomicrobiales bacterium]
MTTMLMRRFGWLAAVMVLLLAAGTPLSTAAQDADMAAIPEGATDGALVSYMPSDDEDSQAPVYAFTVFSFEDDAAAESAFDTYIEEFEASLATDAAAEVTVVEVTGDEAEGLDDLGDQRAAFRVEATGDALAGFGFGVLLVREGDALHVWTALVFDLSGLTGESEATAASVDPNASLDALLAIAPDWFDGDQSRDGALIDQLPGLDALPDGYEEVQRAEGLDEIEEIGSGAGI